MKQAVRRLHVGPQVPDLAGDSVVRATPKVDPRLPQHPKFNVLGSGSLLQVSLPPSTALYARRNSLSAVLGTASAITATLRIAGSPLARLWTRQIAVEQRVLTTEPSTCLIGTQPGRPYLTALELNGLKEWSVTSPAQIHASCGRGLQISPRYGWRPGFAPFAHTTVNGSGLIALACPSPLVQLSIAAGESVLVHRDHLAAYSADANATSPAPKRTSVAYRLPLPEPEVVERDLEIVEVPSAWNTTKRVVRNTAAGIAVAWRHFKKLVLTGNAGYIEVYGPSTVLISASAPQALAAQKNQM